MYSLIRAVFLNLIFVLILVAMSRLGRDKLAFRYQQSLKEQLNGDWHTNEEIRFDTVGKFPGIRSKCSRRSVTRRASTTTPRRC